VSDRYDGESVEGLAARWALPAVVVWAETASTMDLAHQAARDGAPDGVLVVADRQLAGRGQGGRPWQSAHEGVWCTWLRRPTPAQPFARATLDVLTVRCGLALAAHVDGLLPRGVALRLKWPNDLLVPAGKVGGVLVEARWDGDQLAWLAIGVGINCTVPRGPVEPGALPVAALPGDAPRLAILEAIVAGLREATWRAGHLGDEECREWRGRDALAGQRLAAPTSGWVLGIATDGALQLRDDAGERRALRSGPVRLAPAGSPSETPSV
jgi:BirA family biotin operon repressor/biotin-[acetyl-CoA-carboxylase] ligase